MDGFVFRLAVNYLFVIAGAAPAATPARGQDPNPATPNAEKRELSPLPAIENPLDSKKVDLGKLLFFDGRLSGDATVSCATCHAPDRAWTDGLALSKGYPGSLYFRNTPTVLNVSLAKYVYWDGRLPASDLPTVVRDHISEAHFLQADGRLVIERLRQIPRYEQGFSDAFGGEPTYGRILAAVAEFLQSLRSRNAPLDRYLHGDPDALSAKAQQGLEIFRGKGQCIECHHGALLSDGQFHNLGVPTNQDIFRTPERHIVFRRFFRTLGVSDYANLRRDVGRFAVTKQSSDRGRFRTPSLREVNRTAPYMHNGSLQTLEEVIVFYDQGGGNHEDKDRRLRPLQLTGDEKEALVEFLNSLAGDREIMQSPQLPAYELRKLGANE